MTAVAVSYTVHGPEDAPFVVLSNSLGATRAMWDPQVPALAERYRVVGYDTRGHGESPAPAGPYDLDDLVRGGGTFGIDARMPGILSRHEKGKHEKVPDYA